MNIVIAIELFFILCTGCRALLLLEEIKDLKKH